MLALFYADRSCCFAAFMSSPCHIELVLTEKNSDVKNETVRVISLWVAGTFFTINAPLTIDANALFICMSAGTFDIVARGQVPGSTQNACSCVMFQDPKERKLSKVQAAKKLRSGSKSKST